MKPPAFDDTEPNGDSLTESERRDTYRLDADRDTDHDSPQPNTDGSGNGLDVQPDRRRFGLPTIAKVGVVAAILAVLFIAGWPLWNYLQSYESTDDAEIDGHIAPVASRIDGTIARVYVYNTQRVKAGQLLAEIDPRDQRVAVENTRANVALAQAQVSAAQADYNAALGKLRQSQATALKAKRDAERYSALLAMQVVARENYEEEIRLAQVADATVASDRATANSAAKVIAARQAAMQGAQAALDQSLLNLGYTKIVAPFNGVIGKKTVEVGQRVQPGEQLMAVVSLDDVWVTADFKETQIRRMHAGERATIYVDALGRNYDGYVEGIAGASGEMYSLIPPENATGNYVKVVQRLPVRLRFKAGQDAAHNLRPGLSVEPKVWLR